MAAHMAGSANAEYQTAVDKFSPSSGIQWGVLGRWGRTGLGSQMGSIGHVTYIIYFQLCNIINSIPKLQRKLQTRLNGMAPFQIGMAPFFSSLLVLKPSDT